jgi:hypothetical protein
MDDLSRARKRAVPTWARALAAEQLRAPLDAPDEVIDVWVDAAATLIAAEHREAAFVLLRDIDQPGRRLPLDAAAAAWRALADSHRPERSAGPGPGAPRPNWATYATTLGADGPTYFIRELFDLGEIRGLDRPHASVDVGQFDRAEPVVLVEVSGSGVPTPIEPDEARLFARALDEAAALVAGTRRRKHGPPRWTGR